MIRESYLGKVVFKDRQWKLKPWMKSSKVRRKRKNTEIFILRDRKKEEESEKQKQKTHGRNTRNLPKNPRRKSGNGSQGS